MRIHLDPVLEHEQLGRPVAVSAAFHVALFALIIFWTVFIAEAPFQFGDPDGDSGGAVAVNITQGIPLNAPRTPDNPVANPVEHEVPAPKEIERPAAPEPAPPEDAEAVPVEPERRVEPKRQEPAQVQKTAPEKPQNQVPSTTGARASNPIFSAPQSGGGGVGMQGQNPFGQGYAAYANALQRRLAEEWGKTLGQASGTINKPVIVQFRIMQDGRIADIRVVESSGNRSYDYAAHRAVQYINPFQRLPVGLRRSSITVEIWFNLGS